MRHSWLAAAVSALLAVLLVALMVAAQRRLEAFDDMPPPHVLFKRARDLLDKYDQPGVWNHMIQIMDKDPGELARMGLHQETKENAPTK